MKTILPKSRNIIRFWIIEIALNLLAYFLLFSTLISENITAITIVAGILIFAVVAFKVTVLAMNILLFLEIKKKYDLMLMGGIGENRGEFENLYSLKNNLLIITIFEWLFPIVSLIFKFIYWNKIREISSAENSDNQI